MPDAGDARVKYLAATVIAALEGPVAVDSLSGFDAARTSIAASKNSIVRYGTPLEGGGFWLLFTTPGKN